MDYLQEKQINLREIWQVLMKRKWLMILPLLLVIAISYGGSYLIEPKYESSVVIYNAPSQLVTGDIRKLIGDYSSNYMSDRQVKRMMNEIRGQVTSGVNLAQVISQLNLDELPTIQQKAAELKKNLPNISVQELVYRTLIEDLRNKINVSFTSENMIRITVQQNNPILARDIAQTLAEVYQDEKLGEELSSVRSQLDFSNNQANIYKKELEDREDELAEFKRNYQKSTMDKSLTTEDNLRGIESEIDNVKLRDLVETNDRLSFLESQLKTAGIDPADLTVPVELNVSKRLLLDQTTTLAQLMEKYTWRDAKINTQRRLIESNLDSLNSLTDSLTDANYVKYDAATRGLISDYLFTRIELDYYIHKEERLNHSKENIKNSFTGGPEADLQLTTLEQAVNRARELYDGFLESYTGSQISMEVFRKEAENRYKIIEAAYVPLAPYWPNRMKITLMGCALGLLLGIGAVILAEVTDNSIKKIESIESLLNVKVLGTIPKIEFRSSSISREAKPSKSMSGSKT